MNRKENVVKLIENLTIMIQADTGLRNSQKKALQQFLDNTDTPERGIFNLATGVGKTRIMSMLALAHLQSNPNSRVIVGIPSIELFQQEIDAFQQYRDFQEEQRKKLGLPALNVPKQLDMGVFNQDDKNTSSQIIFTSYQSLEKFSQQVQKENTGLLLLDEAHHVISDRRAKAVNSFTNAMHYGMTATPWYSPERNAENVLGKVIAKISIRDAIQDEEPALAEYKNILIVSNLSVDLSDVKKDTLGDYKEEDYCNAILRAMRGNSVNSGNVENWQEAHHYIAQEVAKFYHGYVDENVGMLNGKKCLINCRSQEEARIQAQELNKLFGRIVARMHTSDECDDQTITDFKEGNLPIVCQVGKLTEGFDMPNLDMTINYPTASLVREAQGAARCIRLPRLDSHTPGILPKKMGLVVDIAFKHPAYDNIVDAIRQNGQVLFQDVDGVGSPVIQHTDERLQTDELDEKELTKLRKERSHKNDERLGFTIVSDVKELQRLTHEANEAARARYIPPKREGMRSAYEFKEYAISPETIRPWLESAFKDKEVFYLDSDIGHEHPLPLVEYVNSYGHPNYCLHEAPEALKRFEELHPVLLKARQNKQLPPKREGMRSACEFKEYATAHVTIKAWLESAFNDEEVFYLDSDIEHEHPLPLVEYVINSYGHPNYCLHEAPEALKRFEELHPVLLKARQNKQLPPKREGMRSAYEFKEYTTRDMTIRPWLESAFNDKEVFYLDSDIKHEHPLPLIEYVIDSSWKPSYCLHEAPEALKRFEELYPELLKARQTKQLPPKRKGMRSADGFKEYTTTPKTIKAWLESAFNDNEVFYKESDIRHEHPLPLVEFVKPKVGTPSYCLHEAPDALKRFEELHPVLLKARQNKQLPPKREGMRSACEFKEYTTAPKTIKAWLESAFNDKEEFYLDSDIRHEHPLPLVEFVKSHGIPRYCLHEAPEALEAFKKFVKKTYDKELKERTSAFLTILQGASEKAKEARQPIEAPNTPKVDKKSPFIIKPSGQTPDI